ncbi:MULTISPECIES: efflux RND transporter periplasmic adaptor subunit [Serratia]|jgi:RND family efflux transporter MFP subunit|uniref:HlyD family secretion protein n=1 Tax=Serratia fonticola TaxID=47917 RepID=A0ABY9PVP4_SERFO|nr:MULTISPECIES: HlyD family secretion protein [Serratia]ATM78663.1 HlyD family secretion protein [Serratia fonticola]MBC3218954.1 HlyD family secretion protein [Serratia fonticola]MBC3227818.1 HlyD family secretion protein [Serratia fonticola]NCG52064.1 efflux RND transporter periplasmic adaptor subunit [Serratia fonticola]OCJ24703.1 efflux transporter periplasmic adaptor subunit [Serratia sp. 14-2641]
MKHKTLKYFSTVIVCAIALCAGWWLWNYYMQSPWTRDGKVRAELVNITPEVSGRLEKILVHDNQFVTAGSLIFNIDPVPYQIALDNAEAALAKAQADMAKADHEAARRRSLPRNVISSEDLDESNLAAASMKASYKAAQANLEQAKWNLSKTRIYAPTDGYITNLQARVGNYATAGTPLVALVDTHSFYVLGYFEETKLRHIREGRKADIVLYNGNIRLQGVVESIGRAIYDQSADSSSDLLMDVKPNVPWVRLAQRVPVRIKLIDIPADLTLVAGTTCTISIHQQD